MVVHTYGPRRLEQGILKFEVSVGYVVRPWLKDKTIKQAAFFFIYNYWNCHLYFAFLVPFQEFSAKVEKFWGIHIVRELFYWKM